MKETKVCSKCGRELPVDAYYKGNCKDGLDSYCKECRLQYNADKKVAKKASLATEKPESPKKEENSTVAVPGGHQLYKIYYNKDLAKYPPRELMMELKARGYVGELQFEEVIVKKHRINLGTLN